MPTHEFDTELLYLNSNGEYVPFNRVSEATICDDIKKYHCNPMSFLSSTEAELTFTMNSQAVKQLRKMIRKMKNHMMRKKRRAVRRKEKLRRLELKVGRILQ